MIIEMSPRPDQQNPNDPNRKQQQPNRPGQQQPGRTS